jgi:RNA polymerase primary sigma factor
VRRLDTLAADSATLQSYLQEIAKFPRLAVEQEHELGRRIRQQNDSAALNLLVEANLRFVVSYTKRYRNLGVSFLDLIHEGNLGLIEAARRFDPDQDATFITYGVWWIRQSIMHLLSERSHIYTRPKNASGAATRFRRQIAALQAQLDHQPTTQEIVDQLEISEEEAQTLLRLRGEEISLNDCTWVHAAGDGVELGDTLHDHAMREIDDDVTRDALVQELEASLSELDPKERRLMRLRYGLQDDEPWTLQQIADKMRLSRDRVRQLESRAMQKLRRRKNLRSYLN